MAKYIVFSDSHGKNDRMYDIIRKKSGSDRRIIPSR